MMDGSWTHHGMMVGFDAVWYWLMGFHGAVFLLFLLVTVIIGFDLYREWHSDRSTNRSPDSRPTGRLEDDEHEEKADLSR